MRSRLWLVTVLVLLSVLLPCQAYANEGSLTKYEQEQLEQTNERLMAPRAVTPLQRIKDFFYNVRITFSGSSFGLFQWHIFLPAFLRLNKAWLWVPAVLLVFMYWGVRKVIRMLFRAFRRGKANV